MEIDHVFIFTDAAQEVASTLSQFGLTEGSANTHPGQGTACRRFFFQNAYLEIVWVADEDELRNEVTRPTKLWERSKSRNTGYSPFGICFRSQSSDDSTPLFEQAWLYQPSFVPPDQYVLVAANEAFPNEPMFFEFPFQRIKSTDHPTDRQQPLIHPKKFEKITKVTIISPVIESISDSMKQVLNNSIVNLAKGDTYCLSLEFDQGKEGNSKSFQELLPLIVRW